MAIKKYPNHEKIIAPFKVIKGGEKGHNRAARRMIAAVERKYK